MEYPSQVLMNTSVCETPPWNLKLVYVHSAIGSKSTSPHPWPKQRENSYLCMNLYKQSVWARRVPPRQESSGWLEKAMAPHSSTLAWKIPWAEEPGRDHGVVKSQTQLSDFTFPFHFHALEKEMATHSSVLAWRIPGMGEPGGLSSTGSHRVRHD